MLQLSISQNQVAHNQQTYGAEGPVATCNCIFLDLCIKFPIAIVIILIKEFFIRSSKASDQINDLFLFHLTTIQETDGYHSQP